MRVVILGTGTGVGKTYVTAELAKAVRDAGVAVTALKPVETGVTGAVGEDAALIATGAGHAPVASPWVYRESISPHLAARREGRAIELREVTAWVERSAPHVLSRHVTLVETAGGTFSPLSRETTNRDLARQLQPALWILVGHDGLGVLHDVRACLLAMAPDAPAALVLSGAREPDSSTGTNADELRTLGVECPIAVIPRGARDGAPLREVVELILARTAAR